MHVSKFQYFQEQQIISILPYHVPRELLELYVEHSINNISSFGCCLAYFHKHRLNIRPSCVARDCHKQVCVSSPPTSCYSILIIAVVSKRKLILRLFFNGLYFSYSQTLKVLIMQMKSFHVCFKFIDQFSPNRSMDRIALHRENTLANFGKGKLKRHYICNT